MTALIAVGASGCARVAPPAPESSGICAGDSLVLTAGSAVPTRDGIYRPRSDEIWHSPAAMARTRGALDDALRVIENERNLPKGAAR